MLQSFWNCLQEETLMIALTGIRKMGVVATALLIVVLAGTWTWAQSQSAPAADEVSKLRILYVGHPGSEREKDFVQFLGQHFETVKTADLSAFAGKPFADKDMAGFDVAILDYDGDGFKAPRARIVPRFPEDASRGLRALEGSWLTRPLITVGVTGGLIASQAGLKTGYL
jgi:hypothetical protein